MATLRRYMHQYKEMASGDPYRAGLKFKGLSQCRSCHAVTVRGRWVPKKSLDLKKVDLSLAQPMLCPACAQTRDEYAQGVVELHGDSWEKSRTEVMQTIRNTEKTARSRNDQIRVISIRVARDVVKVYVTLPELARRIGRELEKSFHGIAEYEHSSEEKYLRVRWWSDLPHVGHQPGSPLRMKRRTQSLKKEKGAEPPSRSRAFRNRGM